MTLMSECSRQSTSSATCAVMTGCCNISTCNLESVLFLIKCLLFYFQLLLIRRGRRLAPPWWVYLVCGWHQTHPGWRNAERQMWRDLPHPWEPITERLVRLLCGVSSVCTWRVLLVLYDHVFCDFVWSIFKNDLFASFQCGGWYQALRHLQDSHRLWIRRALQSVLIPQRPGAPLQKRLLGPTQRPAECKPGIPSPGPLSEPEPAPQMNHPPAVSDAIQGGETKIVLILIRERMNLWTMLLLV